MTVSNRVGRRYVPKSAGDCRIEPNVVVRCRLARLPTLGRQCVFVRRLGRLIFHQRISHVRIYRHVISTSVSRALSSFFKRTKAEREYIYIYILRIYIRISIYLYIYIYVYTYYENILHIICIYQSIFFSWVREGRKEEECREIRLISKGGINKADGRSACAIHRASLSLSLSLIFSLSLYLSFFSIYVSQYYVGDSRSLRVL